MGPPDLMDGLREALAKALADIAISFISDVCKQIAFRLPRELEGDFRQELEGEESQELEGDESQESEGDESQELDVYNSCYFDESLDRQTNNRINACVICLDNEKCCFVSPCMHLCICSRCANNLIELGNTFCPICRTKIKNIKRVYS